MSKMGIIALLASVILLSCDDGKELTYSGGEKRLAYYTEGFVVDGSMVSESKTTFSYDAKGRLSKYSVYFLNNDTKKYVLERYFNFSFLNEKLDNIIGYTPSSSDAYIMYTYNYLPDGNVNRISESNLSLNLNSEATFTYNEGGSVKVVYAYSNGSGFTYEFELDQQNIISDRTLKGAEECNVGSYTYDEKVNPFSRLGYIDFLLNNISLNNKISEDVNYQACSFPSLEPETYSYEYDADDYPTKMTTTYKGSSTTSQRIYYYNK